MIPIGDDNSMRRTIPVITYLIIVLNFIVFFMELAGGDPFINTWSFVPARFLANPAVQWITIFTAMFMHGGWLHILGNMLYLFIFGDNVEDRFGHIPYLIFYLVCGVVAFLAQMFVDPTSAVPNLGASGAIAGVLGAYIVLFPHGRVRVLMGYWVTTMPAIIVLGFWILLQFVNGVGAIANTAQTDGVAYMAHVGGFVAGIILALFLRGRRNTYYAGM